MNNNQITNPKVEVAKGKKLNDKDYMTGLLSELKALEKNYTVALTEASNESLYSLYKKMFDEIASLQRQTYELMFRYGWYPMQQAEENKVSQKLSMLRDEFNELS